MLTCEKSENAMVAQPMPQKQGTAQVRLAVKLGRTKRVKPGKLEELRGISMKMF